MTETDTQKLPESDAEVTFVGRSNVGKSTLINTLCQKKEMAAVSKVPGKTRRISVYEVKPHRFIVDLPGYGYAVGSKSCKPEFGSMIEKYLTTRNHLRMVFIILDAVVGPTKLDISMISWLKFHNYPYHIIINKIDKMGSLKLKVRKKEIVSQLGIDSLDIFWISSKKKIQIEPLQKLMTKLLDA